MNGEKSVFWAESRRRVGRNTDLVSDANVFKSPLKDRIC